MTMTIQRCETESKDGKKFLRKVIRDNNNLGSYKGWSLYASSETDWYFELRRTIEGTLGEPDSTVFVRTDSRCRTPPQRNIGDAVKPYSDSEPVFVPQPVSVRLSSGDAAIACKLLIDGADFRIVASCGSSSSSKHGLAFLSLTAILRGVAIYSVTIGSESVFVNGRQVISGAINIR